MFTPETVVPLVLRWVHFLAGITWIGLLYYFNLVQIPFLKETDAAVKSGLVQKLLPRALWWFRWSAVATVAAGILLMMASGIRNTSIMIGGTLGIVMFLNVWLIIWPNQKVVIRMTTEAAATKTQAPPEIATHARRAYLASRTNFVLSFPMLFFMAASHQFTGF